MSSTTIERSALVGTVIAASTAAAAGWFGYGLAALVAGLIAAILPFLQWRAANASLSSRFARRALSEEDFRYLVTTFKPLASLNAEGEKQRVSVFATTQTFESTHLARQISSVMSASDWSVNPNKVNYGLELHVVGVGILAHNNPGGTLAANQVAAALSNRGIAAFMLPQTVPTYGQAPSPDPSDPYYSSLSILVGDKP